MMKSNKTIIYRSEKGLAEIIFNRPVTYNSLPPEDLLRIGELVRKTSEDPQARVLVFTGTGKAFSSGGDLAGMTERMKVSLFDRRKRIRSLIPVIEGIRRMEKPAIAKINGVAAGAGLGIALACDIRIASDKARFAAAFSRIGFHPDMGVSYLLPRVVGASKALELLWTGEVIDAREALRIGLVNRVVRHAELDREVDELAGNLVSGPGIAIGMTKLTVYGSFEMDMRMALESEANNQTMVNRTDDAFEGVRAFVEQRKPKFRGK